MNLRKNDLPRYVSIRDGSGQLGGKCVIFRDHKSFIPVILYLASKNNNDNLHSIWNCKNNNTVIIWNGESPECDFHFSTNQKRGQRTEALPPGLSITPTMHYIARRGRGGAEEELLLSFSGQTTLTIHPLHPVYRRAFIPTHLQVFMIVRNNVPCTTRRLLAAATERRLKSDQATMN